jgi:lipoate-protein ligase B
MPFAVRDLGRMSYQECLAIQLSTLDDVLAGGEDTLLFVEHDPVLTLGANFHEENLLLSLPEYAKRGIEVVRTDRGGDVTYHGPGQLVIYPIFDVAKRGRDLHRWLRDLEETMLVTLASMGLEGRRFPPHTGAWIGDKKVAAIGIKVKRWVSMHGIALNCSNDLGPFHLVIPCGIQGYGVTSLSVELGRAVDLPEAKTVVEAAFRQLFD